MALAIAAGTAVPGIAAALFYARAGLTLAHFDARAHLVVARRIVDSLMPGWQQIGAVWLPLPHVLNMLPVQVDAWYRTGASATAISIASMAVAAGALASFIVRRTGSVAGAAAGAVLMMANPNVLYLQSTPMTEPLLFGVTLLSIATTADWLDELDQHGSARWHGPSLTLAAACLTRYEAWPICAAIGGLAFVVLMRRGLNAITAGRTVARLAIYPAIAVAIFILNSRWTVGSWFVSSGFFVAENEALGQPLVAWDQVREGLYRLSGVATVWPAYAAALVVLVAFARDRARAPLVLVLALVAAALLPCYAYYQGHPFRIRYSIPLVVACAAITATAIALLPRFAQLAAAAAVVAVTVWHVSPLDQRAPIVVESQRDAANAIGRRAVTAYLAAHWDGRPIMMSMGSLAHYMHDLSRQRFAIHDFLHEGNGEVWESAFEYGPRAYVRWVAIEESAEGGDALFQRARDDQRFLRGFDRVAEGGGVALYRATPPID